MRVVIANDFGDVNGGASKVAILSATGLAHVGIPVTFFCAVPPLSALLSQPRITVECPHISDVFAQPNRASAATQGIWNQAAKTRLGELLAELSPSDTVVHFHHWTRAFSPSVIAAATDAGFPTLLTLHDYFAACPNGAFYNYQHARPCPLRPLSLSCITCNCDRRSYLHKTVRVARQAAANFAIRRHPTLLSFAHVSRFARSVIEPYLSPGARHFDLPNPIDVARGSPASVRDNREFVFIGRFTVEKGTALLAEATRKAGIPITYVGSGDLESTIRTLNPAARIIGWMRPTEMAEVLSRARALVFPSLWSETGGLVVSEALAMGVPVIASRSTGPADLIESGRNGLLFDRGNLMQLVDCLQRLRDDETAARMGLEAFEGYWRQPQTLECHIDPLSEIYRALLQTPHQGGRGRTPSDRRFDFAHSDRSLLVSGSRPLRRSINP